MLVDLPPATFDALAQATRTGGVTLINVSTSDDALRAALCQPQLHTIPSEAMLADGLAQYPVSRKVAPKVLVLVSPRPGTSYGLQPSRPPPGVSG